MGGRTAPHEQGGPWGDRPPGQHSRLTGLTSTLLRFFHATLSSAYRRALAGLPGPRGLWRVGEVDRFLIVIRNLLGWLLPGREHRRYRKRRVRQDAEGHHPESQGGQQPHGQDPHPGQRHHLDQERRPGRQLRRLHLGRNHLLDEAEYVRERPVTHPRQVAAWLREGADWQQG